MTDQITVPRETWDAMRGALEHCEDSLNSVCLTITASIANEALTAANAVSEPQLVGCAYYESNGACCESGEPCKADMQNNAVVQPQAQGEAVYLVATGETHNGEETYCRYDYPPALSEFERLYTHPQATEPAGKKLIGWRTADYLRETGDPKMAKNWEVHYEILPIFEGDANTKLAAAPEAKQ